MITYYLSFFVAFHAIKSIHGTGNENVIATTVSNINDVSLLLTRDIMNTTKENFVFSPYSITKAMLVLHAGAKGMTRTEIERLFLYSFNDHPDQYYAAFKNLENEFDNLNDHITFKRGSYGIFNALQLNQSFVSKARSDFSTEIRAFNLLSVNSVVRRINREIGQALGSSASKAQFLALQSPDPSTVGLLYNYVYLKGDWSTPFPIEETRLKTFSWTEGNKMRTASIPMMHHESSKFLFENADRYRVVGIPFHGEQLALFIFLNNDHFTLQNVIAYLYRGNRLTNVIKNIESDGAVEVTLPKFEVVGKDMDLKSLFKRLSISRVFTENADLSGIVPENTVFVNAMKHKAFLKIDETGGEAGGATEVEIVNKFGVDEPEKFVADRPFLFVVGHRPTGAVLFQGVYQKPPQLDQDRIIFLDD